MGEFLGVVPSRQEVRRRLFTVALAPNRDKMAGRSPDLVWLVGVFRGDDRNIIPARGVQALIGLSGRGAI